MNTIGQAIDIIKNDTVWGNAALLREGAHIEVKCFGEDDEAFLFKSWVVPDGKTIASCSAKEIEEYADYDLCVAKEGNRVDAIIED